MNQTAYTDTARSQLARLATLTDVVYAVGLVLVIQWLPMPEESHSGGVVWLNKRSGGQKAIFPLTIILREAIELPAGLTRERGVRLIVPDGVPKPRGAKQERVYMDVK